MRIVGNSAGQAFSTVAGIDKAKEDCAMFTFRCALQAVRSSIISWRKVLSPRVQIPALMHIRCFPWASGLPSVCFCVFVKGDDLNSTYLVGTSECF